MASFKIPSQHNPALHHPRKMEAAMILKPQNVTQAPAKGPQTAVKLGQLPNVAVPVPQDTVASGTSRMVAESGTTVTMVTGCMAPDPISAFREMESTTGATVPLNAGAVGIYRIGLAGNCISKVKQHYSI